MTNINHNKPLFGPAHFPKGTVCVVELDDNEPMTVEVTSVTRYSPTNYIITTTSKQTNWISNSETTEEPFSCNISWVTRIIKRGEGVAVLDKTQTIQSINKCREDHRNDSADIMLAVGKHPSQYLAFEIQPLLRLIVDDYRQDDMLVDMIALTNILFNRGLIMRKRRTTNQYIDPCNEFFGYVKVSKKKLRKAIKQVINKCLVNHRKAQENEDVEYRKMCEEDLYNDIAIYDEEDFDRNKALELEAEIADSNFNGENDDRT